MRRRATCTSFAAGPRLQVAWGSSLTSGRASEGLRRTLDRSMHKSVKGTRGGAALCVGAQARIICSARTTHTHVLACGAAAPTSKGYVAVEEATPAHMLGFPISLDAPDLILLERFGKCAGNGTTPGGAPQPAAVHPPAMAPKRKAAWGSMWCLPLACASRGRQQQWQESCSMLSEGAEPALSNKSCNSAKQASKPAASRGQAGNMLHGIRQGSMQILESRAPSCGTT